MKLRLRRILSILCVLALMAGCLAFALAEADEVTRAIMVEWSDEDNYDGFRPESVTMQIGNKDVTLNESNGWSGEATVSSDAKWTIAPVAGYTVSSTGSDIVLVTYSRSVKTTGLSGVTVVWDDNNNAAGLRPDSVKVNLLADGNPARSPAAASAANSWTVSWESLPIYREKSKEAEAIVYSVSQVDQLDAYTTTVSGATITNTLKTGKLSLKVSASAPEGADVSGLRVTVSGPDPQMPVTLTYGALAGGVKDFGDVIPGAYVVQDNNASTLLEGYTMDPAGTQVGDAVYVNAGASATLNFKYTWKEAEEQEVNEDPISETGSLRFEITGPDGFSKTFTYADFTNGKYVLEDLAPGTYAVIERNAEGLVTAYTLTSDSTTGMVVTVSAEGATASLFNKYEPAPTPSPEEEFIDIPVAKIWNDNDNKDGNRPASITVNLYANGVLNETRTVTAADGWAVTFTEKPQYDENGEKIVYTVNEEPVAWYTSSVNGYFITNTYQPEVTSAAVVKIWDDNNNERNIRPTSIAVTLRPTGEVFVLSESNGWSIVQNNLPTKINGEAVTYSWSEQETVGYVKTGETVSGSTTTFTNRAPEIPTVPEDEAQPKVPTTGWVIFEEYSTALGGELLINHVGDCFD